MKFCMRLHLVKNACIAVFLLITCYSARAQSSPPPSELVKELPASAWIKYTVDEAIGDSIRFHVSPDRTANYQVMITKASKTAKKRTRSEYLSYVSMNRNDSINIILLPKAPVNLGFRVVIVRDSCTVFFFAYESEPADGAFKLKSSDAGYSTRILVPPKLCSVVLMNKPEFKQGEVIVGHVEFESQPYRVRYDKYYDEAEQSYVEGYFNTSDFIGSKQD